MNSDIKRYRDNLRDELNGAALYAALAAAETDPIRKHLFLRLAQAESSHAQLWRPRSLMESERCSERRCREVVGATAVARYFLTCARAHVFEPTRASARRR